MFTQEQSDWMKVVNPATGKVFPDYTSYSAWAGTQSSDSSTGGTSGTGTQPASTSGGSSGASSGGYDWSGTDSGGTGTTVQPTQQPVNQISDFSKTGWNIDYNNEHQGVDSTFWYAPPANTYGFQIGQQEGYFDPGTGQFYTRSDATKPYSSAGTYSSTTDYGLGSSALGVVPLEHNGAGQVTVYLAPTKGGGYQKFNNLADAQASVSAYNTWAPTTKGYGASNLPGVTATDAPPASDLTGNTGKATTAGTLTVPGTGEQQFTDTKQDYANGAVRADAAYADKPTQPTESDQLWNKYSGIFQNPDSLQGVYDRAEQRAQTTLDRKASSSGWADSGAAAKATANIGQNFNDAYVKAVQDWAKTGMGLATSADQSNSTQFNDWIKEVTAATGIDEEELRYLAAGQDAADHAQTLGENRQTGGFDRSLQIANNMAGIASAGLKDSESQTLAYNMADLQTQMSAGTMDYQTAAAKLSEYMSTMGLSVQAAGVVSNYFKTKSGGGTTTPTTTTDASKGSNTVGYTT